MRSVPPLEVSTTSFVSVTVWRYSPAIEPHLLAVYKKENIEI